MRSRPDGHTAAVPPTAASTDPGPVEARLLAQRRFRLAEAAIAALALGVVLALLVALPADAGPTSDAVTDVVLGIMLTLGLQWAVALRLGWRVYALPADRRLRRRYPFRGWWFTPATPVLATVLVLPWALDGVFGLGSTVAGDLWLLFLLFLMAALLGLLAVPAVLVPLELLVRGVVRLATARGRADRRDGTGYLWGAVCIGSLTAFVLVVGGGASFGTGGRAAWGGVVLALLGVPAGYTVENPALLWVGRAMFAAVLAYVVVEVVRRRRARR